MDGITAQLVELGTLQMNLETVKAQLVALHNEHIAPTE